MGLDFDVFWFCWVRFFCFVIYRVGVGGFRLGFRFLVRGGLVLLVCICFY